MRYFYFDLVIGKEFRDQGGNDPLTPTECDCFALLSRELPENALCRCEVSLFWWLGRPALRHVPEKPSIPISNVFASPSDIKVLMQGS
jgi:hypothetical protein